MSSWRDLYTSLIEAGVPDSVSFATVEVIEQLGNLRDHLSALRRAETLLALYETLPNVEVQASLLSKTSQHAKSVYLRNLADCVMTRAAQPADWSIAFSDPDITWPKLILDDERVLALRVCILNVIRTGATFEAVWKAPGESFNEEHVASLLTHALADVALLEFASRALAQQVRVVIRLFKTDTTLFDSLNGELILEYQRRLSMHPKDWHLWLDLAESFIEGNQLQEAGEAINNALELNSRSARALLLSARIDRKEERLNEAIDKLQRAVALYPNLVPAWGELAEVLLQAGHQPAAVEAYTRLRALEPSDELVRKLRSRMIPKAP